MSLAIFKRNAADAARRAASMDQDMVRSIAAREDIRADIYRSDGSCLVLRTVCDERSPEREELAKLQWILLLSKVEFDLAEDKSAFL